MGGVMLRRSFFSWKRFFLPEEVFFPSDQQHQLCMNNYVGKSPPDCGHESCSQFQKYVGK
jgi:hypothetical protein